MNILDRDKTLALHASMTGELNKAYMLQACQMVLAAVFHATVFALVLPVTHISATLVVWTSGTLYWARAISDGLDMIRIARLRRTTYEALLDVDSARRDIHDPEDY